MALDKSLQTNMKRSFCKKTIVSAVLIALVVTSVFAFALAPSSVARALTFGGKDMSSLWYYGEKYLDVAAAKEIVSSWDLSKATSPVVIAVIDTGIDAKHSLFADDENGVSVLCKNANGDILGYNSYTGEDENGSVDISDASSKHGSSVAGSIALMIREFGLEKYIKIYPIKANTEKSDNFTISSLASALDWAVDKANADVVNMSLGLYDISEKDSATLSVATEKARRQSVVVAAAGNNPPTPQANYYPAAYPGVVSVMNQNLDTLYSTSNFGTAYTLCAPGYGVWTSKGYQQSKSVFDTEKGTSMSATFVSFAAALLKLRCRVEGKSMDYSKLAKAISLLSTKTLKKGNLTFKYLDFKSIVQTDLDTLKFDYEAPTSIAIKHDGKLGADDYAGMIYMRADSVSPVNLYAQVNPVGKVDPDVESTLVWSVTMIKSAEDDTPVGEATVIGSGTSVTYTPSRGGDFLITAKIPNTNAEQSIQLHVEYGNYYVGEVRVTLEEDSQKDVKDARSAAKLYSTETTRFALTGMKYLNPDVETKWFVNGEYVASGLTFDFTPKKAGVYYITAQYGDNAKVDFEFKFTADVKSFILRPLDLSMLIVGLVLAATVAATAIVIAVRKKNAAKTAENSGEEN